MAALWEAPFDACLYLDADTCVWGDILSIIPSGKYDFITGLITERNIYDDTGFFNPQKLSAHFPEFDYCTYRARYFCTGAFFFQRGAMDLAAYQQAWALQREDRTLFFGGEQGILNLLVFHGVKRGNYVYTACHSRSFRWSTPKKKCAWSLSPLCLTGNKPLKPAVLHFTNKKAHIFTRSARVATMNHFRLQYLLRTERLTSWKAVWQMALEDIQCFWHDRKYYGKLWLQKLILLMKALIRSIVRPTIYNYAKRLAGRR